MAKSNTRTIVRYEKKRRKGHKTKFTIPLAVVMGFAPVTADVFNAFKTGGATNALVWLKYDLLGIDTAGKFSFAAAQRGWFPILGGFVAHGLANRFGLNRTLSRMGIPLIRI